eukprot:m.131051 g.131051  ORF g.131051 m.131051 type:complete len:288 (-) comp17475_c0_seq27:3922-4785(-)
MSRQAKKERNAAANSANSDSADGRYIKRFNIEFLGSSEVARPKDKSLVLGALQTVLQKKRPAHPGTITITEQGIKWVKSGMYNGALYGINRVLFSLDHSGEGEPYFSFVVKDKTAARFIVHCFFCRTKEEATRINSSIGHAFKLVAATQQNEGAAALHSVSKAFEDSQLVKGNLLSTPLDQGLGVDANEAMAAVDAGFDATGWSTPSVSASLGSLRPRTYTGSQSVQSHHSTGSAASQGSATPPAPAPGPPTSRFCMVECAGCLHLLCGWSTLVRASRMCVLQCPLL